MSLLGEWDDDYRTALEARMSTDPPAEYLRWSYLDFTERFRPNFGVAVGLIADAPPGVVCVHCVGGRDRTGLDLRARAAAGGRVVSEIGRDYAESEQRLAESPPAGSPRQPTSGSGPTGSCSCTLRRS